MKFKKNKAHTNINDHADISRYHALGTKLANDQAIHTRKPMDSPTVSEFQQCFQKRCSKKKNSLNFIVLFWIYKLLEHSENLIYNLKMTLTVLNKGIRSTPCGMLWKAGMSAVSGYSLLVIVML